MSEFYAATITIGRNVPSNDNKPLSPIRWAAFRSFIRRQLLGLGLLVTVSNSGHGEWDGTAEENHVIVALWELPENAHEATEEGWSPLDGKEAAIAEFLTVLKGIYRQEAIAFAWGPSRLV